MFMLLSKSVILIVTLNSIFFQIYFHNVSFTPHSTVYRRFWNSLAYVLNVSEIKMVKLIINVIKRWKYTTCTCVCVLITNQLWWTCSRGTFLHSSLNLKLFFWTYMNPKKKKDAKIQFLVKLQFYLLI